MPMIDWTESEEGQRIQQQVNSYIDQQEKALWSE